MDFRPFGRVDWTFLCVAITACGGSDDQNKDAWRTSPFYTKTCGKRR